MTLRAQGRLGVKKPIPNPFLAQNNPWGWKQKLKNRVPSIKSRYRPQKVGPPQPQGGAKHSSKVGQIVTPWSEKNLPQFYFRKVFLLSKYQSIFKKEIKFEVPCGWGPLIWLFYEVRWLNCWIVLSAWFRV